MENNYDIRRGWAQWIAEHDWNICGTLNFAANRKPSFAMAERRWSLFWNKIDRLCFGQSRKQQRLPRFVFAHHGSNRDNAHSHFLARVDGDAREFCVLLNAIWAGLEHADTAIADQNEILPLFSKQRASWYLIHEDHGGEMSGFSSKLTHLPSTQPTLRNTALIDLRSAANRFQHLSDATNAFDKHIALVEQRYSRRHAK